VQIQGTVLDLIRSKFWQCRTSTSFMIWRAG